MPISKSDAIRSRRLLLQNPYAYCEELASGEAISKDRKALENQYAHMESIEESQMPIGRFDGITLSSKTTPKNNKIPSKSYQEIEAIASKFHKALWENRERLFPSPVHSPVDLLDPITAITEIGFHVEFEERLYTQEMGVIEDVAGAVDKKSKMVRLSRAYSNEVMRFTAAHELGHIVMHGLPELHRDRPIGAPGIRRDQIEVEADKFASFFLMPAKLVCSEFLARFRRKPLEERSLTQSAAPAGRERNAKELRAFSRKIAAISHFDGIEFIPMHVFFQVSIEAMAIRLEELDLVRL